MNSQNLNQDLKNVDQLENYKIEIENLKKRLSYLEEQLADILEKKNKVGIVVFSGDLDRVLAALIIATGVATFGKEVSVFFTFWGLNAIKVKKKLSNKKWHQRLFAFLNPASASNLPVSKMNFFGLGSKMLKMMMKEKNVSSLEDLVKMAKELGVKFIACEMSKDVLGIEDDELIEGTESGGVAYFLSHSLNSSMTIFI